MRIAIATFAKDHEYRGFGNIFLEKLLDKNPFRYVLPKNPALASSRIHIQPKYWESLSISFL